MDVMHGSKSDMCVYLQLMVFWRMLLFVVGIFGAHPVVKLHARLHVHDIIRFLLDV